mmetsp:Transcript_30796/g.67230  ORF Transcript_30796/g.67230 Transcript_30796/m.67230 type:complete len:100 (+) Transcript_30796:550-849(+)
MEPSESSSGHVLGPSYPSLRSSKFLPSKSNEPIDEVLEVALEEFLDDSLEAELHDDDVQLFLPVFPDSAELGRNVAPSKSKSSDLNEPSLNLGGFLLLG